MFYSEKYRSEMKMKNTLRTPFYCFTPRKTHNGFLGSVFVFSSERKPKYHLRLLKTIIWPVFREPFPEPFFPSNYFGRLRHVIQRGLPLFLRRVNGIYLLMASSVTSFRGPTNTDWHLCSEKSAQSWIHWCSLSGWVGCPFANFAPFHYKYLAFCWNLIQLWSDNGQNPK